MSIPKAIYKWTAVVPVRFARAINGAPQANAPDPDDRGFTHCIKTRHECAVLPVGLDESLAEAAIPETRVRLVRVDMENGGQLFITSSDAARLEVTMPAAGAALPSQEKMMIKFKVKTAGKCFLEVRFGAANGPIVHRLQIVVNAIRRLQVKAHAPRITGATTINDKDGNPIPFAVPAQSSNNTVGAVRAVLSAADAICFPYGIQFDVDPVVDTSQLNLSARGAVDLYIPPAGTDEFDTTVRHNRVEHGIINIYFVSQIIDTTPDGDIWCGPNAVGGVAMSARNNRNDFGVLLADWAAGGQTTAHELGHVLNLVCDPKPSPKFVHVNTREDPASPGTGRDVRNDIISRRRLMWAYTNLLADPNMPYRSNVGYGANQPGSMLTIKQFKNDRTDLEMQEVQSSARWLLNRP